MLEPRTIAPEIFVAVPVFHGEELIAETLRSIRDQTYVNYRVLISVDNNDAASAAACRPFLSDPRVKLVVQQRHLGWAGNLNWLIERCDCPFFVYWQQDDLTATNYLEVLRAELMAHPAAAIAYADIQWFGARFDRESGLGVHGAPAQRLLQTVEVLQHVPLRGLIRADFLMGLVIPVIQDESCLAEFHFLSALAARGDFHRVAQTLYFKRAHGANTFRRWHDWPAWRRRRAWIEMGLGLLRVAERVMPAVGLRRLLLVTLLDRLAIARPGRAFFYQPPHRGVADIADFVRDFLDLGGLGIPPDNLAEMLDDDLGAFVRPVHPDIKAAINAQQSMRSLLEGVGKRLARDGSVDLDVRAGGDGLAVLGSGWSAVESWGVWTDGEHATIRLPITRSGRWRVVLTGHHYAGPAPDCRQRAQLCWRCRATDAWRREIFAPGANLELELDIDDPDPDAGEPLQLQLPDSVFLPNLGLSDARQLGFGLEQIRIIRRD